VVATVNDEPYFAQAVSEYQRANDDSREFSDLPTDVQQAILHHAQLLKQVSEQEKRG